MTRFGEALRWGASVGRFGGPAGGTREGMTERGDHGTARSGTGQPGTPEKDPADWVTGDEAPTGPQLSYLHTLAREAGQEVPDGLTKADASRLIDELQERTGRGERDSAG